MKEEMIILVDENDIQKGVMGKMEVHKQGYYIEHFLFL